MFQNKPKFKTISQFVLMLTRQIISTTTIGKSGIGSLPEHFDKYYDPLPPSSPLWSITEWKVTDRDRPSVCPGQAGGAECVLSRHLNPQGSFSHLRVMREV